MASPYFFEKDIPGSDEITLSEETSRHISQVLANERRSRNYHY